MSKSNDLETDLLGLLFNATAIANIADNATTSPLTNLYLVLHTARTSAHQTPCDADPGAPSPLIIRAA